MKITVTINVTPVSGTDTAGIPSAVAGAVAASVQGLESVQSVEVGAATVE